MDASLSPDEAQRVRGGGGRTPRNKVAATRDLRIRLTDDERAQLDKLTREAGYIRPADFIRETLLSATSPLSKAPSRGRKKKTGEVFFAVNNLNRVAGLLKDLHSRDCPPDPAESLETLKAIRDAADRVPMSFFPPVDPADAIKAVEG